MAVNEIYRITLSVLWVLFTCHSQIWCTKARHAGPWTSQILIRIRHLARWFKYLRVSLHERLHVITTDYNQFVAGVPRFIEHWFASWFSVNSCYLRNFLAVGYWFLPGAKLFVFQTQVHVCSHLVGQTSAERILFRNQANRRKLKKKVSALISVKLTLLSLLSIAKQRRKFSGWWNRFGVHNWHPSLPVFSRHSINDVPPNSLTVSMKQTRMGFLSFWRESLMLFFDKMLRNVVGRMSQPGFALPRFMHSQSLAACSNNFVNAISWLSKLSSQRTNLLWSLV